MRAAYIHGIRDVRVGEAPEPEARADDIMLRVASVGICGSDLHYYLEGGIGLDRIREPYIPGHEVAARIAGEGAERWGFAPGQLVAVDPARPCGHCERCEEGYPNLCMHMVFHGAAPNAGAMSELFTAPRNAIFPVPEGITPSAVAMMEPLGVALHAIGLARIRLMENIAVLGCGPIGLCVIQLARLCGADRIYAIDPVPYRTRAAEELGADRTAASFEAVADWTGGQGVDLVIEATNDGSAYEEAGEIIRLGGRVILAGIPDGGRYTLESYQLRRKGATVKVVRRMGHVYPRCIRLVEKGLVDLDAIVSHRFELADAKAAFDRQAAREDGTHKVVICPNGLEP